MDRPAHTLLPSEPSGTSALYLYAYMKYIQKEMLSQLPIGQIKHAIS